MLADLQWCFQLCRQASCSRVGHDVLGRDTLTDFLPWAIAGGIVYGFIAAKLGWKPTVGFRELVEMMVKADEADVRSTLSGRAPSM